MTLWLPTLRAACERAGRTRQDVHASVEPFPVQEWAQSVRLLGELQDAHGVRVCSRANQAAEGVVPMVIGFEVEPAVGQRRLL